jgi:hypothetical protein
MINVLKKYYNFNVHLKISKNLKNLKNLENLEKCKS